MALNKKIAIPLVVLILAALAGAAATHGRIKATIMPPRAGRPRASCSIPGHDACDIRIDEKEGLEERKIAVFGNETLRNMRRKC